jgi:2-dehydro-3-deoxyglucarate aldolase/4-hydroxy-2-oxoheptanedioate aldolase
MKRIVGMMISEIRFPALPLLMKQSGFDFCIIDCEHGAFDYSDVSQMSLVARLCGIRSVVRLPDNSRAHITKFLDMGAGGILLPMTNCAEDIKKAVDYAKYPPAGKRGVSTTRAHTLYDGSNIGEKMKLANNDIVIYAQIETLAGLKNCDEIAAVRGVTGLFLGPSDFSAEVGNIDKPETKKIFGAMDAIAESAQKAGILSGIITSNKVYIDYAKKISMQMLCSGSELSMLISAAKSIVGEIKD